MHVDHVFCETGDVLVGGFLKFLLDIAWRDLGISEVFRVGPVSSSWDKLVVILYFVDLTQTWELWLRRKIWEKVVDMSNLRNGHLVIELLGVWIVVNVLRTR